MSKRLDIITELSDTFELINKVKDLTDGMNVLGVYVAESWSGAVKPYCLTIDTDRTKTVVYFDDRGVAEMYAFALAKEFNLD